MKKVLAVILSLVLLLTVSTSLAAGKINVEKENFFALNAYSDYAYVFAKIKNVGNKPIKVNAGILEVFDAEGENITSSDSLRSYAENLEPDEYTYVYMSAKLEDGQLEKVDDYLLTVTGKSDSDKTTKRLTVQDLDFKRNVPVNKYSTNDYAYFTVVNDTDETIWDIYVVYALLDDDDNILFVESDNLGSSKGLAAGSSIQFREDINSKFMEYYDAHGLVPSKIDVIAYVDVAN
jgi:copper(I)-binding protein